MPQPSTRKTLVQGFFVRPNDRIVFFGDSITEAQLFTGHAETYLALRYPDLSLTFFNAGWGGDTATGGLARLERDVLSLSPTLVVIGYGMNDAAYSAPSREILQRYTTALGEMVRRLKQQHIRVVLLSPSFADVAVNPILKAVDYNRQGLRILARAAHRIARREKVPFADIHQLLTTVNETARRTDRRFQMTVEGFHPDPAGHLVIAFGLLKALGVPLRREAIRVDRRSGRLRSSSGLIAGKLHQTTAGHAFDLRLDPLPFFVEEAARKVLPYLPFQETFNQVSLIVSGLPAGNYELRFGQERPRAFSHTELKRGVNLCNLWSLPPLQKAREIRRYIAEKGQIFLKLWRPLGVASPHPAGTPSAHRAAIRLGPILDKNRSNLVKACRHLTPTTLRILPALKDGELLENGDLISRWNIYGPFPRPFTRDPLGGEARYARNPALLERKPEARQVDTGTPGNCLGRIFGPKTYCLAYALTLIESPEDQTATLSLGSDDGFALWVNGKRLRSQLNLIRPLTLDAETFPIRLKKGPNPILLKVSQYVNSWGFSVRLSGLTRPVVARPY